MLDSVALPSLRWRLETVSLTKLQRLKIDSMQRIMVSRIVQVHRRPQEWELDFFKR